MEPSKPRRRWLRFRLHTLLVMVTALSVILGWVGWELDQRRRENVVIAQVKEMGGGVYFYSDFIKPGLGSDERSWWGKKKDNWFRERVWFVRLVDPSDTQVNDLTSPLAELKNLKWLILSRRPRVSDLSPSGELMNLHNLNPCNTQVSDEQVQKLRMVLPNCKIDFVID